MQTSLDDVPRAERVGLEELFPGADHAGDAADVEHGIDAAAGSDDRLAIAQIGPNHFDAEGVERRAILAADRPNAVAASDKLFDDVQPEKAAAAGNQCVHVGLRMYDGMVEPLSSAVSLSAFPASVNPAIRMDAAKAVAA